MLIDGIPKEVAPTLEKPMTPAKDCNADNVKVKDEGNVGPSGQSFRFICKTFWPDLFFVFWVLLYDNVDLKCCK